MIISQQIENILRQHSINDDNKILLLAQSDPLKILNQIVSIIDDTDIYFLHVYYDGKQICYYIKSS